MAQARKVAPVKRGDVYLVELGPTRGSEIKKTRPAVIVQNDIDNRYSPITVVARRKLSPWGLCSLPNRSPTH